MPLQWSEKELNDLHYPCMNVMVSLQPCRGALVSNAAMSCKMARTLHGTPSFSLAHAWLSVCAEHSRRTQVKAQFEVFAVLYNNLKKCHEDDTTLQHLPSWEDFSWALQATRSRAFGGPFPGTGL